MGTRALIGCALNGKIWYAYCHYDGYVEGVGDNLIRHYSDTILMGDLVHLKSFSALYDTVEATATQQHKDIDEALFDPVDNELDFLDVAAARGAEYVYLWDSKNEYFKAWHWDFSLMAWAVIDIYEWKDA